MKVPRDDHLHLLLLIAGVSSLPPPLHSLKHQLWQAASSHHGTVGPDGLVVDVPIVPGGDGLVKEVIVASFNFVDQ